MREGGRRESEQTRRGVRGERLLEGGGATDDCYLLACSLPVNEANE